MADNNLFFKVLAELSDTEYFMFFLSFPTNGGGGAGPLMENSTFFLKPCLTVVLLQTKCFLMVLAVIVPVLSLVRHRNVHNAT